MSENTAQMPKKMPILLVENPRSVCHGMYVNAAGGVPYVRGDMHAELMRAADELECALREVSQCLSWQVFGDLRGFSENLKSAPDCTQQARHALTAYNKAKENLK